MENGSNNKNINKVNMNYDVNNQADKNRWGYIVCFGTVITFIAGIGHVNSFGLIYNDFINDTNSTAKSLTTAHGVFAIMLAVGGFNLNVILKKYTLRFGGILGAVIFTAGSFLTILITNANQLPLTFGALQGIGFGMMAPVCYTTVNYYYVKKRTQVMSIIKAVQGLILIWYPQLIKKLMIEYGFRGTLFMISGISLHAFPGMLIMRTKTEVNKNFRTAKDTEEKEENFNLLNIEDGKVIVHNGPIVHTEKSKIKKIRHEMWKLLNLKVLNDPVFCNICIGQSFVNFSDLTFFILQPMLLFQYGYSTTQVATCISITAAADVAGRCLLAIFSTFVTVNIRVLYYVATLFTFVIRIAMLQVSHIVYVAVITGILGVLRAWLHVASPLVISNHVPHGDFPGAYAFSMLFAGLVNVSFAPFIGLVKDEYEDYVPAFYVLTLCCVPCLLFWPLEYIRKR